MNKSLFWIWLMVLELGCSYAAPNHGLIPTIPMTSVPQLPPRMASGPPPPSPPSATHLNIIGTSQDGGATKVSPAPTSIYPSATSSLANSIYQQSQQPPNPTIRSNQHQPMLIEQPQPNYPPSFHQRGPILQMPAGPTPVIMQYLPQGHMAGGVQYLQLIPTRPLIVPISPYITQLAAQQQQQQDVASNSIPVSSDQATRNGATPNQQHQRGQPPTGPQQPYRTYPPFSPMGSYGPVYPFFRPNGGMEIIEPPRDLDLNTNEYIPSPGDVLPRFSRGRP